jgi:hypothetical protein
MDSLEFHPGLPCLTLFRPAGGSPLKRPYSPFRGGPPAWQVACCVFYPFGYLTPYVYNRKYRKQKDVIFRDDVILSILPQFAMIFVVACHAIPYPFQSVFHFQNYSRLSSMKGNPKLFLFDAFHNYLLSWASSVKGWPWT